MKAVQSILLASLLLFGTQVLAASQVAVSKPAAKPSTATTAAKPAVAKKAAVRCRDAKGKFITCPSKPKSTTCRDAKGKFIKCPA